MGMCENGGFGAAKTDCALVPFRRYQSVQGLTSTLAFVVVGLLYRFGFRFRHHRLGRLPVSAWWVDVYRLEGQALMGKLPPNGGQPKLLIGGLEWWKKRTKFLLNPNGKGSPNAPSQTKPPPIMRKLTTSLSFGQQTNIHDEHSPSPICNQS